MTGWHTQTTPEELHTCPRKEDRHTVIRRMLWTQSDQMNSYQLFQMYFAELVISSKRDLKCQ